MEVSAPEKIGTPAGVAVRLMTSEGETGAGVNGVDTAGADVRTSPHAFRVSVPAPNPINLMKSLRVILFFEVMFMLYLRKYCLHFSIFDVMRTATIYTISAFQPL